MLLEEEALNRLRARLQRLPELLEEARANLSPLSNVAVDLGTLAVLTLGASRESYETLAAQAAERQPELVAGVERALAEIDGFIDWIKTNKHKMTARTGVGKENYNWLISRRQSPIVV